MTTEAVLYVEDDAADVFLLRRAWQQAGLLNPLHVVSDGQEAQDYLSGEARYANRAAHPMPSLVLLDVKLPRITGLELLKWIREHSLVRALRVVILSSSNDPLEVQQAENLGVSAYWVKPSNPRALDQMITTLKGRWLSHR
jgi:CheY-like chemotaxis protein